MTEERDAKVSAAYRELGAEEPPRALDDAILAAARRSARPWTQRWAVPLSLAAVIVLSVTVTLRLQHEQPGIEVPAPQAVAPPAVEPSSPAVEAQLKPKAEAKIPRRKAAEQPAPAVAAAPPVPAASEPKPFASDQAAASASARSDESRGAASSVTGTLARQAEERTSRDVEAAARAPQLGPTQALKRADVELAARPAPRPAPAAKPMPLRERPVELTPEQELERIADLRRQEKHEEADKALAEFRKRHPDYKISGAMLERVERR